MNTILLDTNAYTAHTKGDPKIKKITSNSDCIYISSIVMGELFSAFENGKRLHENTESFKLFISDPKVKTISVNIKTARIYGRLFVELKRNGVPIPTNDIWIAAHAIETNSVLITYDNHFISIPNLNIWKHLQ